MSKYTEKPTDITGRSAAEITELIRSKEVSSQEVVSAFLQRIAETNTEINSFLHVANEEALAAAKQVDELIKQDDPLPSVLAGVPLALKDIFVTTDAPTTCASKMLENWISPYDATVTKKLRAAGIPILGKTNMDEFAMGSSTETSAYGVTKNPWDVTKVPGGSGGGSAAALASYQAPLAIGTDTGGSIRQPAALTNTVGVKPTYGTVSRYGLVACASSLDQGGPCANNVLDTALLHNVIAGFDSLDSTSANVPIADMAAAAIQGRENGLAGTKIGVIKELSGDGIDKEVLDNFTAQVELLSSLGAEIEIISCPSFKYGLSAYYLIMPSEVSSNLARFDAMRYGLRVKSAGKSAAEIMSLSREAGFGSEVKRRILLGTFSLSAGHYAEYYGRALQIRELIKQDFSNAYQKVEVLISPTTPSTAFKIGERTADPLAMYMSDLCTLPANLAGICGMSLPVGFGVDSQMPIGLQILGPAFQDERLYRVGAALEAALS